MLAFCRCGHLRDEHIAGGGCIHLNRASKRYPTEAVCACTRYTVDPLLDDSEAFIAKTLNQVARKEGIPLEQVDREDLTQVMAVSLWKASAKYDSRSHIRFGSYAAFEIYNDAIDELRSARMFGRQGQYRVETPPPTHTDETGKWDFEKRDPLDELDDDAAGSRRLERAVTGISVDAEDIGSLSVKWALAAADRVGDRPVSNHDHGTDQGATGGARSPGWAAGLDALSLDWRPRQELCDHCGEPIPWSPGKRSDSRFCNANHQQAHAQRRARRRRAGLPEDAPGGRGHPFDDQQEPHQNDDEEAA
jgi:DNA-directed RNA polymerase specialized sigma24 family protein